MKIATFNVNGINGRLEILLSWLQEASPDVVCLQELKAAQAKFPVKAIQEAGYGAIWHGQKSWNGVAILAKDTEPLEVRKGLPGGKNDDQSRYIEAAVNGILVACLYLPNGNPAPGPKWDYKLEWFDRLLDHTANLIAEEVPVVLAGDFNVMPTDLDVYKTKGWEDDALFRPEVRDAYVRLIEQGWTDSLREMHPGERIYTFWDYLRNAYGRNAGLRLDHLLLSPQLAPRLTAAEVDREVRGWKHASDHAPVWIELAAKARKRARKTAKSSARKKTTKAPKKAEATKEAAESDMATDGSLAEYRRKRDFKKTPEPPPKIHRKAGNSFVIQEHHARGHHFDLRLEIDGVLVSWAVPKGIPEEEGTRRLAVHTEDHPLAYREFEGIIPKGEYGAGEMSIWDRGEWEPLEGDWRKQFDKKGTLKFHLLGERLQAPFILARMREEPNWMLMRLNPTSHPAPSASKSSPTKKRSKVAALPREEAGWVHPQLARVVDSVPSGPGWVHEIKLDGYRLIVVKRAGKLTIFTRNGHDWTDKFKSLVSALDGVAAKDFVLDGEAVVFDDKGRTDFGELQNALGTAGSFGKGNGKSMTPKRAVGPRVKKPISFVAFDLLHFDGENLRELPLSERLERLAALVPDSPGSTVTRSHTWPADSGDALAKQACQLGLEGIMSKPLAGTYQPESRKEWVKSKCRPRQEFVVSGYTAGEGAFSSTFGALLLASREDGQWVDRGRVGTGFSERLREALLDTMRPLRTKKPLFPTRDRSITWIEPRLVAEVEFAEITREGLVRQASFVGLREDKPAKDVHMEKPEKAPTRARAGRGKPTMKAETGKPVVAGITISHPDRLIYPDDGVTKLEVVQHYERVGKLMLPFTGNRPLALLRVPDDVTGEIFFQKSIATHQPPHVDVVTLPSGKELLSVHSVEGIISLAQFGVVEFHPWGAPLPDGEEPDFLIWDLDPDPAVPWPEVLGAAFLLRDFLSDNGLETLVKTSGGKGLHIVLHLKRGHGHGWDVLKPFTKAVAQRTATYNPKRFTTSVSLAKRGGKIFIDYLRNGRGATCVAPWCVRARPGAGVSMPISWDDLAELPPGGGFTIHDTPVTPKTWLKARPQEFPSELIKGLFR